MNTTFSFTTTFSKRLIAAAALIGIATASAVVPMTASAAPAVGLAKVDVCSSERPAGVWFPVQVEQQFAAQCASGSAKLASPNRGACTVAVVKHGWVPPQVERQFAEWCK